MSALDTALPGVSGRLQAWDRADAAKMLWAKDHALWKPGPTPPPELVDRLGWLEAPRAMEPRCAEFAAFGDELRREGTTDVLLLGMGGSSLFADLLARTFGPAAGAPALTVLDSTFPDAVLAVSNRVDWKKTVVLVASKSGSTTETACLYEYFRGEAEKALGKAAGSRFVAVTDPGTAFERQAKDQGFRRAFLSPPDVGGRYSALTPFGLVPAAALGHDPRRLLDPALRMAAECGPDRPASNNPAFQLGAWLAEAALAGRDKLTLLLSPAVASLGAWLEQLVAESTGKEGKGILPVDGPEPEEALASEDRVFVYVRLAGEADPGQDRLARELERARRPILTFELKDRWQLGAEVFRWEAATAAAGAALGINPFDQPNVQETKDLTKALLSGPPAAPAPAASFDEALGLAQRSRAGDYLALNAFLAGTPDEHAALAALREKLGRRFRRPVTLGLGPRYLHSTGQLHKGGADRGLFWVLTARPASDAAIGSRPYGFSRLITAQAEGDLQALKRRGRRAVRVDLGERPAEALRRLADAC
ncbi:MAG: glucose-6-phosphate isomerase [Elusimicrobia bacterium]|nr:glucose-6-phosphate isomerase [Elusimicrobiota bacterium]